MFHLTRGLSQKGHRVTILTGKRERDPQPHQTPLANCTERIEVFPVAASTGLRSWMRKIFALRPYPAPLFANSSYTNRLAKLAGELSPDIIFANFLFMAAEPARITDAETRVVLDQHEDEVRHWQGYLHRGQVHERAFALLTLAKVRRLQSRVFSNVDAIATVSSEEAEETRSRVGDRTSVWLVPNGVDAEKYGQVSEASSDSKLILFVGGMGVQRNADAAQWFSEEIFPRIRADHSEARFMIVGSSPLPDVQALERQSGVVVTGTVPDVRPYYEEAEVVVVPQRFGAGTKLKVLEAMAAGRPVVSTSNGIQGLDLNAGEHVLVADEVNAFAKKVSNLLTEPKQARKLAWRAQSKVVDVYSWDSVVDQLDTKLRGLL